MFVNCIKECIQNGARTIVNIALQENYFSAIPIDPDMGHKTPSRNRKMLTLKYLIVLKMKFVFLA